MPNVYYLPALSTIPYPARDVGYLAAETLSQQILEESRALVDQRIKIENVIQRESTDFISIEDEETTRLVRWIRINAPCEPIQVSDLEGQSEYSLSSIKARFKKYLGRSPKDEIKRVRMEHLRHLLQDPRLSFGEISDAMKFSSPHEMSRFFLRETGERPTAFRERSK